MPLFLLVELAWAGTTLEVPGDHPDIGSALGAASEGDTVHVDVGTWSINGGSSDFPVPVVGSGPGTVLVRTGNGPVVDASFGDEVVLSNLTLDGEGGPVVECFASGRVVLTDVVLAGGGAPRQPGGGLVYGSSCSFWMERTTAGPTAAGDEGGHVFVDDSSLTLVDAVFSGGQGTLGGSVHAVNSTVMASGGKFSIGEGSSGGALYLDSSSSFFQDTELSDNVATGDGAGLHVLGGDVTWVAGAVTGQDATHGGGLYADAAAVTVVGATFQNNSAVVGGGGVFCRGGSCRVLDNTFEGNSADDGGGIFVRTDGARWTRNLFCDNTADDGGAVLVSQATDVVGAGNIYVRNISTDRAAAVVARGGDLDLSHETIVASAAVDHGAAVFVREGTLDLTNTLVADSTELAALDEGIGGSMTTGYTWFWNNVGGDATFGLDATDTTGVDPMVANLGSAGCDRADYALLSGSPLIDAGTGDLEPDGTPPDIGATGGPGAESDLDGDGVVDSLDCDPLDPAVGYEQLVWTDDDGDGVGVRDTPSFGCLGPGLAAVGGDCDDTDPAVAPGLPEIQGNGIDDDCDGLIDDADPEEPTWYADTDGDGFGDPTAPIQAATQPPDTADNPDDCDDTRNDVNPDALEVCDDDDVDEDCDGLSDDDDPSATGQTTFRIDGDGDGFGAPDGPTSQACDPAPGFGAEGDCNDDDPSVNPGAPEVWYDGIDQDCDGNDDDQDEDGAPVDDDCDDEDLQRHPGAFDVPDDGIDQDCDGADSEYLYRAGGCGCSSSDASASWGILARRR